MSSILFDWVSDEECAIHVDKQHVYTMDHGAHGWDGMTGIRDAVHAVAGALGVDVETAGDEAI